MDKMKREQPDYLELINILDITDLSAQKEFKAIYSDMSADERYELNNVVTQMKSDLETTTLRDISANTILSIKEKQLYDSAIENEIPPPAIVGTTGQLVVVMKVTRLCNLRCTYCRSWREGKNQTMTFSTMLRTVMSTLLTPNISTINFVWHGGEVTMLSSGMFKKLLWLQEQFKQPKQIIKNTIQTNAVSITDEWAQLLAQYNVTVGISIDGPPELNDTVRLDKKGNPTSHKIAKGIKKLKQHKIQYSALVVVTNRLVQLGSRRLFDYFVSIDLTNINFLNVIPDIYSNDTIKETNEYIQYDDYVEFLCAAFEVWKADFQHTIQVADFKDLMHSMSNQTKPVMCLWSGNCLQNIVTVEPDGIVNPCDKYIGDQSVSYGSVLSNDISELINQSTFVVKEQKDYELSINNMKQCKWYGICHGGCPHDRVLDSKFRGINQSDCCGLSPLLEKMENHIA
jgi:uncharacterized protein